MTPEQFRKLVDEFWAWTSTTDRPAVSWFASLEEWAGQRFHEEYNLQHPKNKLVAAPK